MKNMPDNTCSRLASHIGAINLPMIGAPVLHQAKLLVLDNLGCILSGSRTEAGKAVLAGFTRAEFQTREGTRVPGASAARVSLPCAAAIASMFANALDYDDTLYGHPGSVIVPTALVLAEAVGATGAQLLEAIIAGYEVAGRLGAACVPTASQRQRIWGIGSRHAPAAAAVAAKLLGLDPERIAHALCISASNAPVSSINKTIYSDFGPSQCKNNFAMAVIAGITGATLAESGFTGPLDIFDGETGWWRMIGSDRWEPGGSLLDFGSVAEVLKAEFKPYPCCRFIHSSVEAVLRLLATHSIDPASIERVRVRTFSWVSTGAFAERRPQDMPSAQFSIPYCLALVLGGHTPGPAWYDRARMTDPGVHALADKVELVPWPEADELLSQQWLSEVHVQTGRDTQSVSIEFPLGHPRNPMKQEHLFEKFQTLAKPVLGTRAALRVEECVRDLESRSDLSAFFDCIHSAE